MQKYSFGTFSPSGHIPRSGFASSKQRHLCNLLALSSNEPDAWIFQRNTRSFLSSTRQLSEHLQFHTDDRWGLVASRLQAGNPRPRGWSQN